MSYGVEIYVNGKTVNTLEWEPYNYIDSFQLAVGAANGSRSYTLGAGRVLEVLADNYFCNKDNPSFTVTVSGGTVSWVRNNNESGCNVDIIARAT